MPPRATLPPMRPGALRACRPPPRPLPDSTCRRRAFITLPNLPAPEQTLTASRTLPYPPSPLYRIIADIDSYSSFVPYCTASAVTHWTPPDPHGTRWPAQATLRVGWGGFEELFASKVLCRPDELVEARSGEGVFGRDSKGGAVFRRLATRWTFRPSGATSGGGGGGVGGTAGVVKGGTEVNLSIRFEFANPLYSAVSAAVSDKVAATMIEAFEGHARRLLEGKGNPRELL